MMGYVVPHHRVTNQNRENLQNKTTSSGVQEEVAKFTLRFSSHRPETDGICFRLCRNWHHTAITFGYFRLVVEVSQGLSLHLSG